MSKSQERGSAQADLGAIRDSLHRARDPRPGPGTGAHFARNPFVSLMQSAMYERRVKAGAEPFVEHKHERMGDPFTRTDILGWGLDVLRSVVWRAWHGSHAFNDSPAVVDIDPPARLVLISDWGTGRPEARRVISHAAGHLEVEHGSAHLVHRRRPARPVHRPGRRRLRRRASVGRMDAGA